MCKTAMHNNTLHACCTAFVDHRVQRNSVFECNRAVVFAVDSDAA